jgi:hypothetical protein
MAAEKVLTPDEMYRAAAVVALADAVFAALLWRRVGTEGIRRAKWDLAAVSGVFWFAVWATMHIGFWEPVYSHVFPAWARWVVPPVYAVGYAALALGWRALALRAGRWAVPAWVALWGLTGALTHTYAILARGLLERSPMLQHLTPASAVVFATCEFGFYGCAMLTLGTWVGRELEQRRGTRARARTTVSGGP